MKSILISIKPKWVAKILNGKKIIEIRRNMPKCDLPIDVYIYCTKNRPFVQEELDDVDLSGRYDYPTGEYAVLPKEAKTRHGEPLNGKVVAKFTLRKIERVVSCIVHDWGDDPWDMRYSLRLEESDSEHDDDQLIDEGGFNNEYRQPFYDYLKFDFPIGHPGFGTRPDFKEGVTYGYAWRISDLEIFDEPKDLSEFGLKRERAPQGWCYVEVEE